MPRLSIADCEAIVRALDEHSTQGLHALRAAARLRQRLEQAYVSKATSASRPTRLPALHEPDGSTHRSCTLHVCTSCRAPGSPREPKVSRAGFQLYEQLRAAFQESPNGSNVEVRPAECLSVCPRPCGIALSLAGAWTYLFGDQHPGGSTRDIVDCVSHYLATADGFMPREQRPQSLRASILGRVPPLHGEL